MDFNDFILQGDECLTQCGPMSALICFLFNIKNGKSFFSHPNTFFFSSSWYDRPLLVWQSRGKKSKSFPTQEVRVGLPLVDSSYLTTFHSCTFGSTTKKGVKRTPKTVNLSIYLEERAESLKENSSTPSCPVLTTLLYPLKETISLGCQWL